MPKTITQLPAASSANPSAVVAADNAAGTLTEKVTLQQIAALAAGQGIQEPPNDGNTYGRQSGQWVDLEQATSLQFRQGTDAERLAMSPVPASGEPIYATDTKRLFVGDGTTVGGRSVWMGDTSAYIVCQPGDDIQAKYAAAKLLTPNGAALSATNRATLLVMPGVYTISASAGTVGSASVGLLLDADYVDVIGVGSSRHSPSFSTAGSPSSIGITASDARLVGVKSPGAILPSAGGASRLLVNCQANLMYSLFAIAPVDGIPNVMGGTLVGCVSDTDLLGQPSAVLNIFNGSAIDCLAHGFVSRNTLFQGEMVGLEWRIDNSFTSFRSFQGRMSYCRFTLIPTAGIPGRSTANGGPALAAFTGTCTISQASPAVVTKSSHGLRSGWRIRFSTTGTLPSGLDASTTYYVRYIDANSFSVATTVAGTLINTTTAGSGDHSIVIPPGVEGGRYSYCTTADGEYTTP